MKNKRQRILRLRFDRVLSQSLLKQLIILAVTLLVALSLSYLFLAFSGSEWEEFCEFNCLNKWLLPLYLLIDTNALNNLYIGGDVHGWMLFASSLTFLFGAFIFNGVVIGIITSSIERRVKNHREGHIHYLKSGHHIIMGYDDIVPSIISHIFKTDSSAYILILTSADVKSVSEKLSKSFDKGKLKHIIINFGHRVSENSFRGIHLEMSEQIFVVGNHSKSEHDAINVECVDCICDYLERSETTSRPSRIVCVFKDIDTYAAFKTSDIFTRVKKQGIEFYPYNFFTGWAKQVFIKRKYTDYNKSAVSYDYPCVYSINDGGKDVGITPEDNRFVHLVFVGTTNFAVAFAMEAAHVLHFPNADKSKTRITFIDKNADIEKDEFIARNRHFFEIQPFLYNDLTNNATKEKQGVRTDRLRFTGADQGFLDIEFEFIKGDLFSKAVQDLLASWANGHGATEYLSVFLALSDQRQNFVLGMNMPDAIYEQNVPLFIRQDRSDNFVTNLRKADLEKSNLKYYSVQNDGNLCEQDRKARYSNIYPFGMNETAYCEDDHSLRRAKLINYLYATADYSSSIAQFKSISVLNAIPMAKLWEEADKEWNKLTVALKWSNLYGAYSIRTKLAVLRSMRGLDVSDTSCDLQPLSEDEVNKLAVVEHNRWNVEKLLMGFRKPHHNEDKYQHEQYKSKLKKNKDIFIHHDIRPFDALDEVFALDTEFSRYIPWIMQMTNDND